MAPEVGRMVAKATTVAIAKVVVAAMAAMVAMVGTARKADMVAAPVPVTTVGGAQAPAAKTYRACHGMQQACGVRHVARRTVRTVLAWPQQRPRRPWSAHLLRYKAHAGVDVAVL